MKCNFSVKVAVEGKSKLRASCCHKGDVDKAKCGGRMEREREGKGKQIQSDHKGFEEIGCRD
jgi:hypothetical protein